MKRPFGTSVKLIALSTVSAAALTMLAPAASAESLVDALAAAYQSNPDLQAQRAQQRATDEQVPQALSGWRPTVQAQGSYAAVRDRANLESPATGTSVAAHSRPLTGSVTLTQNLFAGGRTVNATRQAEYAVEAGQNSLLSAEQTTLLNAVAAYMDVIRDQGVVDLNKNNVQVLQRQLEATQDRFRVGELTRTDVAQSEARLSGSKTSLRQAEAQLTASRAAYARVVGHSPEALESRYPLQTCRRAKNRRESPRNTTIPTCWPPARMRHRAGPPSPLRRVHCCRPSTFRPSTSMLATRRRARCPAPASAHRTKAR